MGFLVERGWEFVPRNTCRTLISCFPGPKQRASKVSWACVTSQAIKQHYHFWLPLADLQSLMKELRTTFPNWDLTVLCNLTILYNLACGSGCSIFKLHAIEFKSEVEQRVYATGLQSRARVPWGWVTRQYQSLQTSWTLYCSNCCPANTNLEPAWTWSKATVGDMDTADKRTRSFHLWLFRGHLHLRQYT